MKKPRQKCAVVENPLVSAIVPAHNAQLYIGTTLQSIRDQTYPHLEIIVADDGSSDQTAQIVERLSKKDKRIKYFRQPNQGVASARNLAIRYSNGDFIAPVDADDICYPTKIEKLLKRFQTACDKVGLIYSWSTFINEKGDIIGAGEMSEKENDVFSALLFSNIVGNGSACMIRRICLDEVGLYDDSFFKNNAQGCEDWDLYLRLAESFEFKVVKEFLTAYRKTNHSMSTDYKTMVKSKYLANRKLKNRNPWLPKKALHWSLGWYFFWLSKQARKSKCYDISFRFHLEAIRFERALFVNKDHLFSLTISMVKSYLPFLEPFAIRYKPILLPKRQNNIMAMARKAPLTIEELYKKSLLPGQRPAWYHLWKNRYRASILLTEQKRKYAFQL